jgi:dolichol kinase
MSTTPVTVPTPVVRTSPAVKTPRPDAAGTGVAVSVVPPAPVVNGRNEVPRKLLHITPGLLAFALPLVPHPKPLLWTDLFNVTGITVVLTAVYVAMRRHVERKNESDFWVTTLSYPAIVLGSLFAFRDAPQVTAVVMVALAFGDGLAYLGGTLIGGPRLPWNRVKSWAGTLSFAFVAGPLAVLAYHLEAGAGTSWLAAALCGMGACLCGSIAESLPMRLSDNLRVGLAAAVAAGVMHYAVAPLVA